MYELLAAIIYLYIEFAAQPWITTSNCTLKKCKGKVASDDFFKWNRIP